METFPWARRLSSKRSSARCRERNQSSAASGRGIAPCGAGAPWTESFVPRAGDGAPELGAPRTAVAEAPPAGCRPAAVAQSVRGAP